MKGSARLVVELAASALARFVLNTARRFAYPFGPALARGLDVPLTRITSLVALNQGMGLLSPFMGTLSDRWRPRVMMLIGLACLASGMLAAAVLPLYATVLLALLMAGLGKSCFDPAIQAYVGARVPWARRGFAVGLIEMAWAGSSLIGIPTVGWLIGSFGWHSPFLALGLLAALSVVLLAILLPRSVPSPLRGEGQSEGWSTRPPSRNVPPRGVPAGQGWRLLVRRRAALGGLGYSFCFAMANDFLFVIYGAWLELDFRLPLAALGSVSIVIGVAELIAESLTAFLSDRVGLARAVTGGVALTAAAYLLLPVVARTLPFALAALFLVFITFEFTVVSANGLFTELLPDARGTMMGAVGATSSTGRMVGALLGGYVWLWGGLAATGCVAAALSMLALLSLRWGLRGWRPPSRMMEIP